MDSVTFAILSFEGPDPYAHAGGLGTRVAGLSDSLAGSGFETHLFFIGDPSLPGYEISMEGRLHLHRWCQWISEYHPGGVYDGEESKFADWQASLPEWLLNNVIVRKHKGETVVVLGEEWQTAETLCRLSDLLKQLDGEDLPEVRLLWNANNTFGFERIDWVKLPKAATITTVSRYMKHVMWDVGVDARILPNGIPSEWLEPVDRKGATRLSRLFDGRVAATKVARWDPDKRWIMAVDAVAEMKRLGLQPLLLARGGSESHGHDVISRIALRGLSVANVQWNGDSAECLAAALAPEIGADVVLLDSYLTYDQRRALFHSANAVLANSGIEPFGLVGLETMAVGGVAIVGSTGEDYVTPGHDGISLQTNDPREIVHHVSYLHTEPERARQIRQAARKSAVRYTWNSVVQRHMLPLLDQLGGGLRKQVQHLPARVVLPQEASWASTPTLSAMATA